MNEKTIGILGGMGPEATLDCFSKIIKNTPAKRDQDHLRIIIDSNPAVPDRTSAILGNGGSPVPAIVEGCNALERAGADFIIIPCVSAQYFLSEIQAQCKLPILSIFAAVTEAVKRNHPEIEAVGLLSTTGTLKGQMFQEHLADSGVKTILPNDTVQQSIMEAIYDIKNAQPSRSRSEITADLVAAAESLILQKPDGAEAIIAGCTEIPLLLKQKHLPVPYFDSLNILARAAIRHAGIAPGPLNALR